MEFKFEKKVIHIGEFLVRVKPFSEYKCMHFNLNGTASVFLFFLPIKGQLTFIYTSLYYNFYFPFSQLIGLETNLMDKFREQKWKPEAYSRPWFESLRMQCHGVIQLVPGSAWKSPHHWPVSVIRTTSGYVCYDAHAGTYEEKSCKCSRIDDGGGNRYFRPKDYFPP